MKDDKLYLIHINELPGLNRAITAMRQELGI